MVSIFRFLLLLNHVTIRSLTYMYSHLRMTMEGKGWSIPKSIFQYKIYFQRTKFQYDLENPPPITASASSCPKSKSLLYDYSLPHTYLLLPTRRLNLEIILFGSLVPPIKKSMKSIISLLKL